MKLDLPRISIIVPSYNQGEFIDQTLRSVLGQEYPHLELLVFDGGSTDSTLDILKQYETRISWTSGRDAGQADAINKGLRLATGDVIAFLNSDDLYEPRTLWEVGEYFAGHPEVVWLSGQCRNIDESGREIRTRTHIYKNVLLRTRSYFLLKILNFVSQPATFWRRSVMAEIGYLDTRLRYTMDYDYWLRIGRHHRLAAIHRNLASFRVHKNSKSGSTAHRQFDEEFAVAERYFSGLPILLHRLYRRIIVEVYKRNSPPGVFDYVSACAGRRRE